jgi:hypothetical protein
MWKLLLTVPLAVLALAGTATAADLPAGWWHAEINFAIARVPHTLVLDRGKVVSAAPASLTLREQDGSMVDIPVGPSTRVTIAGRPAAVADLRRGETAIARRIDGGPATNVTVRVARFGPRRR